ncbi:hypothetical protein N181_30560 [Sinorhizobium fredii USDA 205]|uniref:Uncharacterized protein n=2 Tax=Sinorhizobium/Ensifer group TaxID=227292 RepID=A0A2A6LM83_RHIFR|nr:MULTISPECIES: hypothetical protein [Rhizobiaceae]ASY71861.1 hypothetical protein SF83666_b52120 [Sinorhizobium fredii CCBAU 83666]KOF12555.1 hypothetical protein AC244_33630 [Ensifer adhaerens]KSV91945.1 hypothetical protein N181_30560 [Sinorhizobium fredii USDA 205]MBZ9791614.1 hypothetical protein [Rhizobium sp. 3T7]MQW98866.1 hypothetical protein [Sinorhizobium fredii]
MADFQTNFDRLKNSNVIPDVDENLLPPAVRDAIAGLGDDEMAVLENLSKSTGTHIYLNNNHQVICGL